MWFLGGLVAWLFGWKGLLFGGWGGVWVGLGFGDRGIAIGRDDDPASAATVRNHLRLKSLPSPQPLDPLSLPILRTAPWTTTFAESKDCFHATIVPWCGVVEMLPIMYVYMCR